MNSVPSLSMPAFASLTVAFAPLQDQAGSSGGPAARVPGQSAGPAPAGQSQSEGTLAPGGVAGGAPGGGAQTPPQGPSMMFYMMFAVFAFMIVSMMMSGRKQRKQVAQMLAGITRGDTVQTSGGIIGVVGEVRDDVVVLKIDESTHTKMKVTKSSISRVVKSASDRGTVDTGSQAEHEAA